ncbi:hypothetical protein [Pleurocapsa sp. FMAR1]|uniref:hypothetical protein n=1 Tax=Pleurocapsa sp. FMAR1 TaxID=3040204 RepID=UPI0029C7E51C|nr:hypothetical protein [Pleurocapsa sp. FMAR1]
MTTFKKIYNANKDDRPVLVSISCEIATRAQIETDCHRLVPVDTKIIHFEDIPHCKVYLPCGGTDYKYIAKRLQEKGYGSSWCIKSVWVSQSEPDNYI